MMWFCLLELFQKHIITLFLTCTVCSTRNKSNINLKVIWKKISHEILVCDNKILSRDQDLRSVTRQIFILDRNYCPLGWISLSNNRNIEWVYCFSISFLKKLIIPKQRLTNFQFISRFQRHLKTSPDIGSTTKCFSYCCWSHDGGYC